jgi:hypothetical protein
MLHGELLLRREDKILSSVGREVDDRYQIATPITPVR